MLRDREEIFWDMLAKLRSSEPIVLQAGQRQLRLEFRDHSSAGEEKEEES